MQPETQRPRLPLHDRIFWLGLSLAFLHGLVINVLPVTFKVFQKVFDSDYEMQGRTEALYFIGALLGSFAGGQAGARIPLAASIRCGVIFAGLGCLALAGARNFWVVQAASLTIGFGAAWTSVIYYSLVARHFPAARQRVFSAMILTFSLSGTAVPFLLGNYVSHGWLGRGWPWWAPFLLLSGAFALRAAFLPAIVGHAAAGAPGPPRETTSTAALLRSPALWMLALLALLHGLGQMGATVWLARLYEGRLHLPESRVGLMISTNLVGVVSGRILLTTCMAGKLPDRILLAASATLGGAFYLLSILNHHYVLGLAYMFAAGVGVSGDMIAISSFTAQRFQSSASKAFGVTQALGQIGSALGPYMMGFVGARTGSLELSVWLIPSTIGCIALLASTWEAFERRGRVGLASIPQAAE